jgi:phosphoacetylglucosamine mutase
MYYYLDDHSLFHMLDGDKIAALVAAFIVDLVKLANLDSEISVGVVQTAYANGASTKYLTEVSHLYFTLTTGLKTSLHSACL